MFIIINHMISLKFSFFFFFFFAHLQIAHFLEYAHYFWMIIQIKKKNNFQTAKVQPQDVT